MKKAFKLFGFIALSMTLAVACGNANTTPAEEEVVEEQATEVVEEAQVEAPAQQVAPAKEEETVTVATKEESQKAEKIEQGKNKLDNQNNLVGATVQSADASKKAEKIEETKGKLDVAKKGGVVKGN